MRSPLPGRFNVSNTLAALATAAALGVGLDEAVAALASFRAAPGRFEPVDEGQDFAVLVDYAHTPDSLENVLRAARDLTRRARDRRLRRRRRPRPGQAPADGGDRRPPGRRRGRHLGQPALRGPRGDHRGDPRGGRARRGVARRSPRGDRARGRAGVRRRRGGRRRQGPRAGPGVRGRRASFRSTTSRWCARPWAGPSPDEGLDAGARRRGRGRAARLAAAGRQRPARERAVDRLAPGRARRPVRRPAGRARGRRRASRPRRSPRARGARIVAPDAAEAARCAPPGVLLAADDPLAALQRLAGAWRDALERTRCRRHRVDRQDVDQGHPRRPAGARTSPRWPAPRTSTPRSACRWRSSGLPPEPRRSCSRWRCAAPSRSPS